MNEVLLQILVAFGISFVYGLFKKYVFIPLVIFYFGLLIVGFIINPTETGNAVIEGFAFWRLMVWIGFGGCGFALGDKIRSWWLNR